MIVVSAKSNLGCEAGCGLTGSWSDHSWIILGSCSDHAWIMVGTVSDRSRILNDVSAVFSKFLSYFGEECCREVLEKSAAKKCWREAF